MSGTVVSVATRRVTSLAEGDRVLVLAALRAAADGPFFPDWEIETLLSVDRETLRGVAAAWPDALIATTWEADAEQLQFIVINNVLNNLIGYPHKEWDALEQAVGTDREGLIRLLRAWRGDAPNNYAAAIE